MAMVCASGAHGPNGRSAPVLAHPHFRLRPKPKSGEMVLITTAGRNARLIADPPAGWRGFVRRRFWLYRSFPSKSGYHFCGSGKRPRGV